jgi:hypothetical protein
VLSVTEHRLVKTAQVCNDPTTDLNKLRSQRFGQAELTAPVACGPHVSGCFANASFLHRTRFPPREARLQGGLATDPTGRSARR